ncbi:MAG: PH domain-containing protein [Propionibacteriaceae bacterium]|nr:PH domain-containing protein [Propionibacteriaceae bacterium]
MTSDWQRLHPLTPWLRGWAVTVIIIGYILNSLRSSYEETMELGQLTGIWGAVILVVVIIALATTYNLIWWRMACYRIGTESVDLTTGILSRRHRSLRLDQLEAIDIVRPLIARIFGLAELKLESAGGVDSHLSLVYLTHTHAEDVRAEIQGRRATQEDRAASSPCAAERLAGSRLHSSSTVESGFCDFAQNDGDKDAQNDGDKDAQKNGVEKTQKDKPPPSPCAPVAGSRIHSGTMGDGTVLSQECDKTVPSPCVPLLESTPDPLFRVPASWTIRAYLRTWEPWGSLIATLILVGGTLYFETFTGLFAILPFLYGMFRGFWRHIITEMWFSGYAQDDGIQLRHGLTTQVKQSVPASRIQAIRLTQRLWWRKPNWWRVDINIAGYGFSANKTPRTLLIPVADSALAKLAITSVMEQATREETWALISQAMDAEHRTLPFIGSPRSARLFDPLAWNIQGYARSDFALIIRTGRFTRRVTVIPHDRIQGISVSTGPLDRARNLANVYVNSTPGPVIGILPHLDGPTTDDFLTTQIPLITEIGARVHS